MRFSDHDRHHFQAVLTDQSDTDITYLEARHRGHARVEDGIHTDKDTGMGKLPFRDFMMNAVSLELSLITQDLLAWTRALALDGELTRYEPKQLRYRLLHTAGRLAPHARQAVLHLDRDWPWTNEPAATFARLAALPAPTSRPPETSRPNNHDHHRPPSTPARPPLPASATGRTPPRPAHAAQTVKRPARHTSQLTNRRHRDHTLPRIHTQPRPAHHQQPDERSGLGRSARRGCGSRMRVG